MLFPKLLVVIVILGRNGARNQSRRLQIQDCPAYEDGYLRTGLRGGVINSTLRRFTESDWIVLKN